MAQQTNSIYLRDAPRVPGVHVDGFVHSTEAGSAVDGPGIRYVLFVSGCPLRCQYCHNPDAWHRGSGKGTSVEAVLADIAPYGRFLHKASGGVTISGGEPLMQIPFIAGVLRGSKAMGLHTAIDTSGFLGSNLPDEVLQDIDLVLLDIKAYSEATYRALTGVALRPTLDFARRLAEKGKPIWLRYVLVPDLTDKLDEIEGLADFAAGLGVVERADVLPFHKLGEFKWRECGYPYKLGSTEPPSPELLAEVRDIFERIGRKPWSLTRNSLGRGRWR